MEELKDNYIVAVNLIPSNNDVIRNNFNDKDIKKYCISCHVKVINSKKYRAFIDDDIVSNFEDVNLHNINGALVFKIPTKKREK